MTELGSRYCDQCGEQWTPDESNNWIGVRAGSGGLVIQLGSGALTLGPDERIDWCSAEDLAAWITENIRAFAGLRAV